jgi:hypothetical protein
MKRIFIALFALTLSAAAADQPCPIEFQIIAPHLTQGSLLHAKVQWKNITDKEITGAKFQAAFIDATKDQHKVAGTWSTDQKAKPGDHKASWWEDEYYIRTYGMKAEMVVWPVKLAFADGSVWVNPGEGCSGSSKKN